MTREEFKKEYLTNAFFFVKNADEFYSLQNVGIGFGLTNHCGDTDLIDYDMHDVSKEIAPIPEKKVALNLTFFPEGYFQQSCFWVRGASYGDPKSFDKFLEDYRNLED